MVPNRVFRWARWILLGGIISSLLLALWQFHRLFSTSPEVGWHLSIQQNNINASVDACLLDSESMWGRGLHSSPLLGRLKYAFEQLTHDVFIAIKENPVPCESVTIVANLFPSVPIQGRQKRPSEQWIYKYTGQAGCGILVISDWYAKVAAENNTWWDWLYAWHRNIGSWRAIPFATDELIEKIPMDSKANELQRFAKLLKSAAPLYVPREVRRVTYADAKCKLDKFLDMSYRTDLANGPHADIVTLAHKDRFDKPLKDEFINVRRFVTERAELPPVHSDIDRLEKFLGEEILSKTVDMADIQCMTWQRSEAVEAFSRRWFWYIAAFSMRGQLSWNPALFDCGEGLRIKYLTGGGYWPPQILTNLTNLTSHAQRSEENAEKCRHHSQKQQNKDQ
eukprot:Skav214300  [mRNA]  locus=scaffold4614:26762:27943:- [translate_table: standard]